MARRSRIVMPRQTAPAASRGWQPVAVVAALSVGLIVVGQCSGRTVDLRASVHGDAVSVDAHGASNWPQFFACYPVPDAFEKVAIMRQYADGPDLMPPPDRVRIPLDADAGAMTQVEAGWLSGLREAAATCPVRFAGE